MYWISRARGREYSSLTSLESNVLDLMQSSVLNLTVRGPKIVEIVSPRSSLLVFTRLVLNVWHLAGVELYETITERDESGAPCAMNLWVIVTSIESHRSETRLYNGSRLVSCLLSFTSFGVECIVFHESRFQCIRFHEFQVGCIESYESSTIDVGYNIRG